MEEGFLVRDAFNERVVKKLASDIKKTWKKLDSTGFVSDVLSGFNDLGLTERMQRITTCLAEYLPDDFPKAVKILLDSLGPIPATVPGKTNWDAFILVPQTMFVAEKGLDHFEISLDALKVMTPYFSSESAVRPFFVKHPKKMLKLFALWVSDEDEHVRRLVSEGCRPRLPWAMRLHMFVKDPKPVLKLLELLKEDESLYVRRSVANNLNDIAKDHPDLVVGVLKKWKKIDNKGTQWLIKHAARTLLKQGHTGALALLGYHSPQVEWGNFVVDKNISFYGNFCFQFDFVSSVDQDLMIDYILYFMKANGKLAPKVFKLSKKKVFAGEQIVFKKKHSFRKISTRVYYPGKHALEIMINGKKFDRKEFTLKR
jgi:3-methyladenine DNA glycosylase AlkC